MKYIVGALLLYGRAVDNNLIVDLNKLGQHQVADTQETKDAIMHLKDYAATYPSDGITF